MIDKILFLSRDGDIIKQVYNKLYQEDSTEYAYWSRKAATKLMAEDDRHDYFRRFIEHKVNQQYKIAEILEAMELQELGRELVGLDVSEYLTDSNQSKLRKFIESKWECVIKKYKEQHKAAKRYYEEILGLKKKFDFSDKGMVAYNIGNEEPAIILKDKNKFENLKPTIWFEVEDVAIFYKEMLNNGIKFLSEPFKIGTGNAVEFEDPFGNRLGVTDYIK